MRKKINKEEINDRSEDKNTVKYRIINLTESVKAVPYYNSKGQKSFLNLRIQGRGGQTPPILEEFQITEKMRKLEKMNLIKIEKV